MVLVFGVGGLTYLPPDIAECFDGNADDLGDIDFIWGSQGATRLDLVANLAWKMLGIKVEPVVGIEGRGDGRLMFERGEALALIFQPQQLVFLRMRVGLGWMQSVILSAVAVGLICLLASTLGRDFPPGLLQDFFDLPWPLT